MRDCSWILLPSSGFENVRPDNFLCSSDRTEDKVDKYNCIAWAVGKQDNWWWPRNLGGYHWPPGLIREPLGKETIENFIKAFQSEGYEKCDNGKFENGFEKIALYVNDKDVPKHAARSLPNGAWTSKMGDYEDIEHEKLHAVSGKNYGNAKIFFKKANPSFKKPFLWRLIMFIKQLRCY